MTLSSAQHNRHVEPSVVSLFSGAGGLDIGLAASGFRIAYESDIDVHSCATLEANSRKAARFGLHGMEKTRVQNTDIHDLTGSEILKQSGLKKSEIDLLAGGPPCQAFSVFGRRKGVGDDRGKLVFEYARLVADLQPRAFIFENVYGLLSVQDGEVFREVLSTLASPNPAVKYEVSWQRVNARDFGVPQSRDRVIICGVRQGANTQGSSFEMEPLAGDPSKLTNNLPWRTVSASLAGLPSPTSVEGERMANHRGRKHGPEVSSRYAALAPGERDSRTRINRLDPTRPSYTIVVGSDAGGGKGHVHPDEPRELTPRESARLQTFPDWWEFSGNVRHTIRQVGNAVPPLLGFAIGNALRSKVFGLETVELSKGVSALDQAHLFEASEISA